MAFVLPTENETEEEKWDRSQNEYKFPWEYREAGGRFNDDRALAQRHGVGMFDGGTEAWEKKGYQGDADKFRKAVVNIGVQKEVRHQYGRPHSDVGHIFSDKNGGSNTLGNVYMQESSFNRSIQENHDHLNAAMVGYERTKKAMADSRAYGTGFDEGPWGEWEDKAVVDAGKACWKAVGVLAKKGGEVDMRCQAVKRGEVNPMRKDEYGNMHGQKEKIQEMRDLGLLAAPPANPAKAPPANPAKAKGGAVDALSSLLNGLSF